MNISHLGSEAEVQLAEALVAVSEAVVAAAAEVDDTPRVVAVEETTHSDDTVMQQVCSVVSRKRCVNVYRCVVHLCVVSYAAVLSVVMQRFSTQWGGALRDNHS